MPYSFIDDTFLRTHGFLNLYSNYRARLLKVAKGTHQTIKKMSNLAPNPSEIEIFLEFVLTGSGVFAEVIVDLCATINFPNPRDPYWTEFFAGPVARYVTDREWQDIVI
jgi:hypothetical protein